MKLYKDDFDVLKVISIPENIYESEEKFSTFEKALNELAEYHFANVKNNFVKAVMDYCRAGKDYIIVRFKEYFGIIQIIDDFEPCEVNNQIKCFDEKNIYPLQGIKKL